MTNITKEDYKELMYKLYVDRKENKGMKRLKRFDRDQAIIIAELVGKRLISSQDKDVIRDMAMDFTCMESMEDIGKTVQGLVVDSNLSNLSKFAREDDLNNLYLAKLEIEKLIKAIEKNRPNYINFYK
ncbi:hypothetical protein BUY41_09140 [Staphylococcus cohnii]|uniref:hypothetical protein n=1 Tax=Staphylococcus TaxID=1279 RepID=UPI000D1C2E09|nr:hypothetical protein [Staphylococcus sp. GDY8P196P]MCQ9293266.1 hypothetical protein [Staphylococcus cohnii]PTF07113.1 hypothetical protein BUY41_09140 [Staphylococcus cohnii]PTF40771.1 hypothetical protein BUY29_07870 [Staphylococcus cohnii]RIM44584.1 hypothetical protein BUY22_10070 [Staphylococcus cohnii]